MSKLEKKDKFEVASLPHGIIVAAKNADGDLETFTNELDFDFPDIALTRPQIRQILSYVAAENELDETDPTFDLDRADSVSLIDNGEYLSIELQINWNHPLNLPRVAEIDEMMRKIKNMIFDYEGKEMN